MRATRLPPIEPTFLKNFARNCRYTKNRSIGIVFQYKFTIKPVIVCFLCVEFLEINQSNEDEPRLDKTTICPRSTVSSPLMLGFLAVETVEYSLEVPLSIYRFEKVCFPSENAKLAS